MSGKDRLLSQWPKDERKCNLGDCPAFDLTQEDMEYLNQAGKRLREIGDIEEVVKEMGVPSGTCRVNGREVVVNSDCSVSDVAFVRHFKK